MSRIDRNIKKSSGFAFRRMSEMDNISIDPINPRGCNAYVSGRLTNVEYAAVKVKLRTHRRIEMPSCLGPFGEVIGS